MKALALLAALLACACTAAQRDHFGREAARGECNRNLDWADRDRCLMRVNEMYGVGPAQRRDPPPRNPL